MQKNVPLSVASCSSPKAIKARRHLYRWALKELLAKGYSRRAINKTIIQSLKHSEGHKLAFIKWVQGRLSYWQSQNYNPDRHSSFILNQLTPAIELNLRDKGYGEAAIQRITGVMLASAGDTGYCSIAKLWKSTKSWPAAQA